MSIFHKLQSAPSSSTRLPEYDVAKGIGILCVVLGHVLDMGLTKSFIYLFHMPLFFIISGILTSRSRISLYDYAVSKSRSLLVPWLCWWVLVVALGKCHLLVGGSSLYGLNGLSGALSTFWFVPVLFVVLLINRVLEDVDCWLVLALCSSSCGLVLTLY